MTIIFNLFITYGDTFLPSPSSYDELYYELVRCHTTFDALYSMALRYSTSGGDYKVHVVNFFGTNSISYEKIAYYTENLNYGYIFFFTTAKITV